MDEATRTVLNHVSRAYGTPCYVHFLDPMRRQLDRLEQAFGGRFAISYAVKCNPNVALLGRLRDMVPTLDVSSIGEVERGLRAGYSGSRMTFSGPAKRPFELARAVEVGCGEIVCESEREIDSVNRLAREAGRRVSILIRINPRRMPRSFGMSMAGKPSQFGIDEEDVTTVLDKRRNWTALDLKGFHIYSGTNSMSEEAIAENFGIFIDLFTRLSLQYGLRPDKLVFGSGFGIPYVLDQPPLDVGKVADLVNPKIDGMRRHPDLAGTQCILEMGRFLTGPNGYFLTSIISEKLSRGTEIRMCDGGFNNHINAYGMMGTLIRRNWPMWKVNATRNEPVREYLLVGPLCTTLDTLAIGILLPELHCDDVIAIGASGAYGLTASPTHFISHPVPREYLVAGPANAEILDVTELSAEYPVGSQHLPRADARP